MTPDLFRKLAALGLSIDQIAGVLEIFEADAEVRKAQVRARVQKWRSKNKSETLSNVTERSVTDGNVPKRLTRVEDSSSRIEISGKEESVGSPAARPARGTRLPSDFEPDMTAAAAAGLSEADARREREKFKDHWAAQPGQRGVKLDWPATWRNWCRNARPSHRATSPPGKRADAFDAYEDIARQRGWTSDEPGILPSDHENAERLPANDGKREGVVVDLRRGTDWHS